jgi:hypothetical protein
MYCSSRVNRIITNIWCNISTSNRTWWWHDLGHSQLLSLSQNGHVPGRWPLFTPSMPGTSCIATICDMYSIKQYPYGDVIWRDAPFLLSSDEYSAWCKIVSYFVKAVYIVAVSICRLYLWCASSDNVSWPEVPIIRQLFYMGMGQNPIALVNIKIAGKWMFIPLNMVSIGIDPYPHGNVNMARDCADCACANMQQSLHTQAKGPILHNTASCLLHSHSFKYQLLPVNIQCMQHYRCRCTHFYMITSSLHYAPKPSNSQGPLCPRARLPDTGGGSQPMAFGKLSISKWYQKTNRNLNSHIHVLSVGRKTSTSDSGSAQPWGTTSHNYGSLPVASALFPAQWSCEPLSIHIILYVSVAVCFSHLIFLYFLWMIYRTLINFVDLVWSHTSSNQDSRTDLSQAHLCQQSEQRPSRQGGSHLA